MRLSHLIVFNKIELSQIFIPASQMICQYGFPISAGLLN